MGVSSERFDFDSFDEQMQEALAENEKAMAGLIIKHAQGLAQPEIDAVFEQAYATRWRIDVDGSIDTKA